MFRVRVICSSIFLLLGLNALAQNRVGNFSLAKIGINSDRNEYAPVFQNGKLLFTSDNRNRMGLYFSSTDSLNELTNIYVASQVNDTTFLEPKLIDNRLNRCYNSGPAWMNKTGDRLFFSSNESSSFFLFTAKQKSTLQIYESQSKNQKWSKRSKLSFCDKKDNYTHPYLSPGGDTMYFASDREGGFGGFDLYYVVLQNNSWSEPVNLGNEINSARNDLFPSVYGTTLIFSSDRELGAGKLDLYQFSDNQLLRMGAPFNTEKDDFGLVMVDEKKGYFSSNRDGSDDIYFYRELFPDFKDCEPYVKDPFCYTFFEEEADELDEELALEYVWSFGDGTSAKGKEARHCFADYGEYLVELNIVDRTTSQVFFNQTTYPFAIERSKKLHVEGQDTIPPFATALYNGEHSSIEGSEVQRFFWQLDRGNIRVSDTNKITLVFEKEGTHQLTMGVIARALDGSGEEQWCITKEITVKNGAPVPPLFEPLKELSSSDFSVPAVDYQYTLFLGVSDTLLNITTINDKDSLRIHPVGDSLYLYSMGISDQKNALLADYRAAQEMGFSNSQVTELKDGKLVQSEKLAQTTVLEIEKILDNRIRKEQIITSFEIFYDFDVYALTKSNKQQINKIAFDHKSTATRKILISSFTDVKGRSEYNLKLSKKRSLAVRDEFLKNGFPIEQIELEYYGKRVPKNMEPLSDAQRRKSLIIVYEKN